MEIKKAKLCRQCFHSTAYHLSQNARLNTGLQFGIRHLPPHVPGQAEAIKTRSVNTTNLRDS